MLLLAASGEAAAQVTADRDVAAVVLVSRLSDSSAVAEVRRYGTGHQRNIVLLAEGQATPAILAHAMLALTESRKKGNPSGKQVVQLTVYGQLQGKPAPAALIGIAQEHFARLASADLHDVYGVGRVRAIGIPLDGPKKDKD